MKHLPLLLALALTACSPGAADLLSEDSADLLSGDSANLPLAKVPPADVPPAESRAAAPLAGGLLSEPAADTSLGRVHSVGDLSRLGPLSEVEIVRGLNADWAEKKGVAKLTPEGLARLLSGGKAVTPGDKVIDKWHYAPWFNATFAAGGRKWSVVLYLGGLGVITDVDGRRGFFRFDMPLAGGS